MSHRSRARDDQQRPSGSKDVKISDACRAVLFQVMHALRPRDTAEMRGLNLVFRQFDLEEIEAKAARPGGVKLAEYGTREKVLQITDAGGIYLRRQLDRLREVYPEGKAPDGSGIPAGLPVASARVLAPLLDQLDALFPEADDTESKGETP